MGVYELMIKYVKNLDLVLMAQYSKCIMIRILHSKATFILQGGPKATVRLNYFYNLKVSNTLMAESGVI